MPPRTGADRRGTPFLLTSFQAIVKRKALPDHVPPILILYASEGR